MSDGILKTGMASARSKVPWFDNYLSSQANNAVNPRQQTSNVMGCAGLVAAVPLAIAVPIMLSAPWWVSLMAPFLVLPIMAAVWVHLYRRAGRPRSAEEERQMRLQETLQAYHKLRKEKRLHKWIDPVALQLLEAASYHWSRLQDSLNGPFWTGPNLPLHYAAIRDQARQSADQGMAEMVTLAQSCIGKPENDRKKDVESVFDSLFDLEVADALTGLRDIAQGDPTRYSYHTEASRGIFEPCRQIAERLKDLADEIETVKVQAAMQQVNDTRAASADTLDMVLEELRAVKRAETELEDQPHLHT